MGFAWETAGTIDVAAKLDIAARAMVVVRILVLSISCASCGELVCRTILAPDRAAGKAP